MKKTIVFRGNTSMSVSIRTALSSSGPVALPCPLLDQGAIIDNKRLGRALEKIKLVQGWLSISKSVLEISSILDPRHSWNSYLRPE